MGPSAVGGWLRQPPLRSRRGGPVAGGGRLARPVHRAGPQGRDAAIGLDGARPAGLVIFDPSGAFSLQYGRDPAADWPAGKSVYGATTEERAALFRAFYGYFGRYTVDEQAGVVHLAIERSLWPTEEGKTMERTCRVEGRQLTLTTPPYPNGSWFILTFERVGR